MLLDPPGRSPRPRDRYRRAKRRIVIGSLTGLGIAFGCVQCLPPAYLHHGTKSSLTGGNLPASKPPQAAAAHPPSETLDTLRGVPAIDGRSYIRAPGARPMVFGHRGAPNLAPENTLPSDEAARRSGADWIENDVQPSVDGVPHIMHDSTVDRTTNGKGRLRDLTAAHLATLDAGKWFKPSFAGTHVMTLHDQLADLRTHGGRLLLEIKTPHTREEISRIVQEVRLAGMSGRVFVQSFDPESLRITRDLAPELPLGLLRDRLDPDPVALARELRLASYNPSYQGLRQRPQLVAQLHAAGIAVLAWTPDDPKEWAALDNAGVDGIITNRTADLVSWLTTHHGKGTGKP
ncbi:glycerophosphodiester phosphodiesterase family protein [Embleya sp. NPDC005575]|uniref:glycerophosphodiester phosphodiesterase n=1 Tax=Embleya sp. NPDC005575 TaxID=3156892 RepID=UPI0033B1A33F